jgi:Ca2+-binding RTX toxin-like protein
VVSFRIIFSGVIRMVQKIILADIGSFGDDILRGKIQTDNHQGITTLHNPDDFIYDFIYNYGDTIFGKSGADTIIGDRYDTTSQDRGYDKLYGEDGDDNIYGDTGPEDPNWNTEVFSGGGNVLVGGLGKDKIYGGGGSSGDYIYGDSEVTGAGSALDGADKLYGFGGNDYIYGGGGDDFIDGGEDNDGNLRGGLGNDTIHGGLGNDYITGGPGSDIILADNFSGLDDGNDNIDGDGEGAFHSTEIDVLSYLALSSYVTVDLSITAGQTTNAGGFDSIRNIEKLVGTNFSDRLTGGDANEIIEGRNGVDDIQGGLGDDKLYGGNGKDKVTGGTGNDKVYGGADNDSLFGEDGADKLYGDAGNDTLDGGVENDTLYGGAGNDTLKGGTSGADKLYGEAGDDKLYGGAGKDLMVGGLGKDTFYFSNALTSGNRDTISGYKVADDTIKLSKGIFKALAETSGHAISNAEFYTGSGAHDRSDHIIYNKSTGALMYDSDGNTAHGKAAVTFAYLDKGLSLTHFDLVIA